MIVLVHGAWHDASCWDVLATELRRAGRTVIAVDLPIEDPDRGAREYAAAVVDALAAHRSSSSSSESEPGEPLVLVGHSLGGLVVPVVGQMLGPERVAAMVLVAPLLPHPGMSHRDVARAGDVYLLGPGQTRLASGVTGWGSEAGETVLYSGVAEELAGSGSASGSLSGSLSPEAARARVLTAVDRLRPQAWTIDREVTPLREWPAVPTTVVVAADDRVLSPSSIRDRVAVIPDAALVELIGGHFPMLTRPAELADVILNAVPPGGAAR